MTNDILLKYFLVFVCSMVLALACSPASLALDTQGPNQETNLMSGSDLTISASIGYRIDDLDWNVAGGNDFEQYMSKLSELEFNDMDILQMGVNANLIIGRVYYRGSIYFGQIRGGKGTDSDFFYDVDQGGRFSPYSISIDDIKDDDVLDLSFGMGYQFVFLEKSLRIAPLAGVSYHEQNIRMTGGQQSYTSEQIKLVKPTWPDAGARFDDLNSTYQTQWKSSWLGMDMVFELMTDIVLSSSFEYHIADYDATADWNLRDNFTHPVSFTQQADGKGYVAKVGMSYDFAIPKTSTMEINGKDRERISEKGNVIKAWRIGLTYSWSEWYTDQGTESLFLAKWYYESKGLAPVLAGTLNEANWKSQSLSLSLSYTF